MRGRNETVTKRRSEELVKCLISSTNERDLLGNNLLPDYVTHVQEGGFYGWPWFYMGSHQDPRHKGKHLELRNKVITPDILLNPHFASDEMLFYQGDQFPASYSLLPGFGFSLGFSFSLFRSQRPYRIGAHRAKCRKIQSDQ